MKKKKIIANNNLRISKLVLVMKILCFKLKIGRNIIKLIKIVLNA